MANSPRYRAFVSYSHEDVQWAKWLQRSLEKFRLPAESSRASGERFAPVFRDDDALSAAGDLSATIKASLADSENLVVICSPAAASSRWVNEEIREFARLGRSERIFCLVVSDPRNSRQIHDAFPPALVEARPGVEPLAANVSADGRNRARLKLLAGMLGLPLEDLTRRDFRRRQRQMTFISVGSLSIAVLTGWLAVTAMTARDEAQRQAAVAKAVNSFLNEDLIQSIDPYEGGERDITVRQVVNAALVNLEDQFGDESAVEAAIRSTLSRTLEGLGDYEQAMEQALLALALQQALDPPDEFALMQTELDVGFLHARLAEYQQAESYFRRAYERSVELLGSDHGDTLTALNNLAFVVGETGDSAESLRLHEELYNRRVDVLGETHAHTLISMNNIAFNLSALNRSAESIPWLERAAVLSPEVHGEKHPETVVVWRNLAEVLLRLERSTEAELWAEKAYAAALDTLGESHPVTLDALMSLGATHINLDSINTGLAELEQALALRREVQAPTHPYYLENVHSLAQARIRSGRVEDALMLLDEMLAISAVQDTMPDWRFYLLQATRGQALASLGDLAEAQTEMRAAYDKLVQVLGPNNIRVVDVERQLAKLSSTSEVVRHDENR